MKKTLSMLLALVLLLASFAYAEDKLTVFISGSGNPTVEDNVLLPNIIEAMGCDVEWTVVSAEYETQLSARLMGGEAPDIFTVPSELAPTFVEQGLLLKIGDYLDQMPDLVANYSESQLANCNVGGEMYLIAGRPYSAYANVSQHPQGLAGQSESCHAHHAGRIVRCAVRLHLQGSRRQRQG